MQILKNMQDAGIRPDVVAYTTAIKVQSVPVKMSSVRACLCMLHTQHECALLMGAIFTILRLLGV